MKTIVSLLEFIKALIGLCFVICGIYGGYAAARYFLDHSALTETGMQWQRQHNPEFLKAAALERMAKAQEAQPK